MACDRARRPSGLAIALTIIFGAATPAIAAPPLNANPAWAAWFRSLLQPGTGVSCCSISDCRQTEYRIVHDHYEALLGKNWVPVPPDKILRRTDNPTGHAILCWTPVQGVMCFIRAPKS